MPPKRSRTVEVSSSSDTDDGPVVPRHPEASGSSGPAKKTPRKLIKEAPKRNKVIWDYFDPDPDFQKTKANEHAKVETGYSIIIANCSLLC